MFIPIPTVPVGTFKSLTPYITSVLIPGHFSILTYNKDGGTFSFESLTFIFGTISIKQSDTSMPDQVNHTGIVNQDGCDPPINTNGPYI